MKKFTLLLMAFFVTIGLMAQYNVTFNVDMTGVPFGPDTTDVYIAGDFAGWEQPGSNPDYMLTPDPVDPNIYTYTKEFPDGDTVIQYKYFFIYNDQASWDNGEWPGDPNRIAVLTAETTLENVWANKPFTVTFNVDMTDAEFGPDTTDIYMSGSFAGWAQPGSVEYWKMEELVTGGREVIYSKDVLLYKGDYQYKYFMVFNDVPSWDNGEWDGDPNRELTVDTTMTVDDIWAVLNPGINDIAAGPVVSVYPNPCQSFINITFFEDMNDISKIEVYNIMGAVVETIEGFSSETVTINTSELTDGIYFVAVHYPDGVQTAKFVKE